MSFFKKLFHHLSHAAQSVVREVAHDAQSVVQEVAQAASVTVNAIAHETEVGFKKIGSPVIKTIFDLHKAVFLAPAINTIEPLYHGIQHGNLKEISHAVTNLGHGMADMAAYVPGPGTAIATAINTGIDVIEGDGPIATALEPLLNTPPFADLPFALKEVLRSIINAFIEMTNGKKADDAVTDVAINEMRKLVIQQGEKTGLPAAKEMTALFFDSAVNLVIRRKPIKAVGADMLHQGIDVASKTAGNEIQKKIDNLKLPKSVEDQLKNVKDLHQNAVTEVTKLEKNIPPGPIRDKLQQLKSDVSKKVMSLKPIRDASDGADRFKELAHKAYINTIPSRTLVRNHPRGRVVLERVRKGLPLHPIHPLPGRPSLREIKPIHLYLSVTDKKKTVIERHIIQKRKIPGVTLVAIPIGFILAGPIGAGIGLVAGGTIDYMRHRHV